MRNARKLTDRFVVNIKPAPAGKRTEVYDSLVHGLCVRTTDKGVSSYTLYSTVSLRPGAPRVPTRRAIGRVDRLSLSDARETARKWLSQIEKGIDPKAEAREQARQEARAHANTFGVVVEAYIREHLAGKRRVHKDAEEIRRHILPYWKDRPVGDITRSEVIQLMRPLAKRIPATARLVLGHIKRIYSWAINEDLYGLEQSPAVLVSPKKLIGQKKPRTRVLEDRELRALVPACDKVGYPYGPLFKLIALTGARLNEAAGAQWQEIDLASAMWTIPPERIKSEEKHRVPLSKDAVALLQGLNRYNEYLFTYGTGPVNSFSKGRKQLDQAMQAQLGADYKHFEIHDIRRTVRTRLSAIAPFEVCEMIVGHAKRGLQRVYDLHGYEDEMREALELWALRLQDIVDPTPQAKAKVISLHGRR